MTTEWSQEITGDGSGHRLPPGDDTEKTDTPNPTEEQTNPRTFEAWMTAHYNDQWRTDDADWIADQRAAWDARQPQVDRLRAALKRIASTATMASQGRTSGPLCQRGKFLLAFVALEPNGLISREVALG